MKKCIVSVVASVVLGWGVFAYATFDRNRDVEIDYSRLTADVHEVVCRGEVYWIVIPNEVRDLDGYAYGYCKSIMNEVF